MLRVNRSKPRELQEHEDEGHSLPGRWVNSHELRAGDCIITRSGTHALITEIRQRFDDAFPVSNLSIIGHHNYAVGDVGVLVHNESICDDAIAVARTDLSAGKSIDEIQDNLNQMVKNGKHTQKEVDDALAKILDPNWKPGSIPGDADFVGPIQRGWTLAPNGDGAHMVERVNVRGREALSAFDKTDTPRYYPSGTPEAAGAAHMRMHRSTKDAGIGLRQGSNSALSDAELLQRYRRAYSDPRIQGIRGDLRTPNGRITIARNVSPAEAFEALMQWFAIIN